MSKYTCDTCDKTFKRKSNLDYHIEKAVCVQKEHKCTYCTSKFTTKTAMYKHMRTDCKVKKENDKMKVEIYEKLLKLEENRIKQEKEIERIKKENKANVKDKKKQEQEIKRLKKQIKEVSVSAVSNTNNGNVVNGNVVSGNVINNNMALIAFGSEDLSKIDKSEIIKALQHGYNSAIKLTEAIHFNPDHPEFQNVFVSNMKDKYAMLFDGTRWTLTKKDTLIDRIYDDNKNFIEENLEEFAEHLSTSRKNALDRWLNTNENDNKIKNIKENIKILLYNKRHEPMKIMALTNKENNRKSKSDSTNKPILSEYTNEPNSNIVQKNICINEPKTNLIKSSDETSRKDSRKDSKKDSKKDSRKDSRKDSKQGSKKDHVKVSKKVNNKNDSYSDIEFDDNDSYVTDETDDSDHVWAKSVSVNDFNNTRM